MLDVRWFVGIDWGSQTHAVCIVDRAGIVCERREVPHTAVALQTFLDALLARAGGDMTQVAIGIEVPRGAVVELCLERGFAVYAINPKQVDRFRDRRTPTGAKDDPRDAWVISDALRTDPVAFRPVRVDHPLVIQLREWSRLDEDLSVDLVRLTNQLRDLVHRSTPGLLTLCPAANESWLWELLEQAPTPMMQRRLSMHRLERILRAHRISRITAVQLHVLLQEPTISAVPGVMEAVAAHTQLLLPRVKLLATQRREAQRQLERLLEALEQEDAPADQHEHSDVTIVRSMPGIGTRVAARMLAEASQPLIARAYHELRTYSGVAPITKQSGRRRLVIMRHGCHQRLRAAMYYWAQAAAQWDPVSREYYKRLRDRGHSHGRALRSVADRLLRVLVTLLTRGERFDRGHRPPLVSAGA